MLFFMPALSMEPIDDVDVDDNVGSPSPSLVMLITIIMNKNHNAVRLHLNIFKEKADPFFFVQWSSQIINPNTMNNGAKTAAETPPKNVVEDDDTIIMLFWCYDNMV